VTPRIQLLRVSCDCLYSRVPVVSPTTLSKIERWPQILEPRPRLGAVAICGGAADVANSRAAGTPHAGAVYRKAVRRGWRGGRPFVRRSIEPTVVVVNGNVMSSSAVLSWWYLLCVLAALNVAAWSLAARALGRRQAAMSVDAHAACRIQLVLSAVYVFGCAFRCVFPVYDIPRLCLFDTWLSSVAVGRSVATVAELCFVSQWALVLNATAKSVGSGVARIVSLLLVPLIATAEVSSWYAVLSTSNLGHVAENSIWTATAVLVIGAMMAIAPYSPRRRRRVLLGWCPAGLAYVAFMCFVDVPTYWLRHLADQAANRHYLSIAQGLADVAHRRVVSYRWEDWKSEVVWMTLYFSLGVWFSISLTQPRVPAARSVDEGKDFRPLRSRPARI
jgi:hypothetical protein